jgi:ABC-2 type transport system permease protein
MNKLLLVARHEYLTNLRRRSFLFAVFGVPLFTFFMWGLIFLVMDSAETNIDQLGKVGYVDQSGVLVSPTMPKDYPNLFVAYPSPEAARTALDAKEIGAYFVVSSDYLKNGAVQTYSYSGIPDKLKDVIGEFLLTNLSKRLPSGAPLERIEKPVKLNIHVGDSGRNLTEANLPVLVFMPLIFAFVFMMSSSVTSGFLMHGVVQEKTNRIMEILITTITPMQLLLGKILGLGLLGLTQIVVWGVASALLLRVGQSLPFLAGIAFPTDLVLVFLVYFILSYFLFSSLMAGIGVLVGSEQESRQFSGILSLIWVIPFFALTSLISDPNSPLAIALTLIPFTAPLTALLRLGFSAVPSWQIIASLLILLVTAVVVTWASARVFRWGLLLYGKRVGPRELLRVIRQAPPAGTVVATQASQESAA